ncbi:MAG: hypothetical protein IKV88_04115 [Clostridia bacterium]|nr:hypothetical protein [Clostridia bacterium]
MLCSILIFSSSGCNRKTSDAKDRRILDAIGTLSDYWSNTYYEKENIDDNYLEIEKFHGDYDQIINSGNE